MNKPKNNQFGYSNSNQNRNKFNTSTGVKLSKKYNDIFVDLIDIDKYAYGTSSKSYINVLSNKELAEDQSQLLNQYIRSPDSTPKIQVDLDYLSITMKCTEKDVERIFEGMRKFSYGAMSKLLTIKKVPTGSANGGGKNNGGWSATRPLYKRAYRITIGSDTQRSFRLYIASGENHPKNLMGLRINYIPDRFSDFELKAIFWHLRSVLTTRRYTQLLRNARVTRFDVGFNMAGVMSPFVYAYREDPRIKHSGCLPKGERSLKETTYIGSLFNSNPIVVYDKGLKEAKTLRKLGFSKKQVARFFRQTPVTSRAESRHNSHRTGRKAPQLGQLPTVNSQLTKLKIMDPEVLPLVDNQTLHKLLVDKTNNAVIKFKAALEESALPYHELSLDKEWFNAAHRELLEKHVDLILEPKPVKSKEVQDYCAEGRHLPELVPKNKPRKYRIAKARRNAREAQNAAIMGKAPYIVVIAAAGSGKTHVMMKRIDFLIKNGINPNIITALAFTNKAADEMKSRLTNSMMPTVSTFSAWCFSLLRTYCPEKYSDTHVLDDERKKELLAEVIRDLGLEESINSKQLENIFSNRINRVKPIEGVVEILDIKLDCTLADLEKCHQLYEKKKKAVGAIDFDDMLHLAYKHLKNNKLAEKVASSNKYLLMDEMQDSSIIQWEILDRLVEQGAHLFCVGDSAQAIYSFRGGNYQSLDEFEELYESSEAFELVHSYRLPPEILQVSNVIRKMLGYHPSRSTKESGQKPYLSEFSNAHEVREWIAADITSKLRDGKSIEDIKVLMRTQRGVKNMKNRLAETLVPDNLASEKDIDLMVMTMHAAKGTECKISYVIDPRFGRCTKDAMDNELRLMYVALTRASEELYICKSLKGRRIYKDARSKYILDVLVENNEELFEFLG